MTRNPSLLRRLLTRCLTFAFVGIASAASLQAQSVSTDKLDYQPGETAIITGTGFHADEFVTLEIDHLNPVPPGGNGHEPWDVQTDANGSFTATWYVDPDDSFGSVFLLTADCPEGLHADWTFTDACGTGVVYVTSVNGCLGFKAGTQGGNDFWEVVEGGSYTITIAGVTECAGNTITVFAKASPLGLGNFCFVATRVPATNDFVAQVTFATPNCFSYQLGYKCGTLSCASGFSGSLVARGPSSGCAGVDLRMSIFDSNCNRLMQDEECAAGCVPCALVAPPDRTVECGESTAASATGAPTGCAAQATFTDSDTVGDCPVKRVILRQWSAPDGCGGTATATQRITVVDTTAPTIGAAGPNGVIDCSDSPSFTPPSALDSCGIASIVLVSDETTPTCGNTYSRTITWKAVDECGNSSGNVSQTISTEDTTPPSISAPGANGSVECPASPIFTPPTADDDCGTATVEVDSDVTTPACGNTFSRKITWSAVDACGNRSAPVSQTIAVVDTTPPTITCPPDKILYGSGGCSAGALLGTPTVSDDCGGAVVVTNDAPATFPVGLSTVTWTVKDACNNTATCEQKVIVQGQICALKFYDANTNGIQDGSEPVIPGWKFVVTNVATNASQTGYAGPSGSVCFNVVPGTYSVTEVAPSSNWVVTTQPWVVAIGEGQCAALCTFGNYCTSSPSNGFTIGYWGNKNGQSVLVANDPAWRGVINGLNLKNANGTDFNVPTSGSAANAAGVLDAWLKGANATNMAYMLSAQLAATTLNVHYKGLSDGSSIIVKGGAKTGSGVCMVPFLSATQPISCGSPALLALTSGLGSSACGCTSFDGTASIADIRARANCLLGAYPIATSASTQRTYEECVKNLLDMINNNGNNGTACGGIQGSVNAGPSSCPFPPNY